MADKPIDGWAPAPSTGRKKSDLSTSAKNEENKSESSSAVKSELKSNEEKSNFQPTTLNNEDKRNVAPVRPSFVRPVGRGYGTFRHRSDQSFAEEKYRPYKQNFHIADSVRARPVFTYDSKSRYPYDGRYPAPGMMAPPRGYYGPVDPGHMQQRARFGYGAVERPGFPPFPGQMDFAGHPSYHPPYPPFVENWQDPRSCRAENFDQRVDFQKFSGDEFQRRGYDFADHDGTSAETRGAVPGEKSFEYNHGFQPGADSRTKSRKSRGRNPDVYSEVTGKRSKSSADAARKSENSHDPDVVFVREERPSKSTIPANFPVLSDEDLRRKPLKEDTEESIRKRILRRMERRKDRRTETGGYENRSSERSSSKQNVEYLDKLLNRDSPLHSDILKSAVFDHEKPSGRTETLGNQENAVKTSDTDVYNSSSGSALSEKRPSIFGSDFISLCKSIVSALEKRTSAGVGANGNQPREADPLDKQSSKQSDDAMPLHQNLGVSMNSNRLGSDLPLRGKLVSSESVKKHTGSSSQAHSKKPSGFQKEERVAFWENLKAQLGDQYLKKMPAVDLQSNRLEFTKSGPGMGEITESDMLKQKDEAENRIKDLREEKLKLLKIQMQIASSVQSGKKRGREDEKSTAEKKETGKQRDSRHRLDVHHRSSRSDKEHAKPEKHRREEVSRRDVSREDRSREAGKEKRRASLHREVERKKSEGDIRSSREKYSQKSRTATSSTEKDRRKHTETRDFAASATRKSSRTERDSETSRYHRRHSGSRERIGNTRRSAEQKAFAEDVDNRESSSSRKRHKEPSPEKDPLPLLQWKRPRLEEGISTDFPYVADVDHREETHLNLHLQGMGDDVSEVTLDYRRDDTDIGSLDVDDRRRDNRKTTKHFRENPTDLWSQNEQDEFEDWENPGDDLRHGADYSYDRKKWSREPRDDERRHHQPQSIDDYDQEYSGRSEKFASGAEYVEDGFKKQASSNDVDDRRGGDFERRRRDRGHLDEADDREHFQEPSCNSRTLEAENFEQEHGDYYNERREDFDDRYPERNVTHHGETFDDFSSAGERWPSHYQNRRGSGSKNYWRKETFSKGVDGEDRYYSGSEEFANKSESHLVEHHQIDTHRWEGEENREQYSGNFKHRYRNSRKFLERMEMQRSLHDRVYEDDDRHTGSDRYMTEGDTQNVWNCDDGRDDSYLDDPHMGENVEGRTGHLRRSFTPSNSRADDEIPRLPKPKAFWSSFDRRRGGNEAGEAMDGEQPPWDDAHQDVVETGEEGWTNSAEVCHKPKRVVKRVFHGKNASFSITRVWKQKFARNAIQRSQRLTGFAAGYKKKTWPGVAQRRMHLNNVKLNAKKPTSLISPSLQNIIKDVVDNLQEATMVDPETDEALLRSLSRGERKQVLEIQRMTGIECVTVIVTVMRMLWDLEPNVVRTLGSLEPGVIQQISDT